MFRMIYANCVISVTVIGNGTNFNAFGAIRASPALTTFTCVRVGSILAQAILAWLIMAIIDNEFTSIASIAMGTSA
jgi:hypothetical protein